MSSRWELAEQLAAAGQVLRLMRDPEGVLAGLAPVLPLDQAAVEAAAAAERAQTVELSCARPGCGAGYSSHRRPGSACAGFQWVSASPPPRTLGYHSTPESP